MVELEAIKDTVQNVAEAIAAVLDLDVSIIDRSYVRLGATGQYAPELYSKAARDSLFDHILKTGRPGFIEDAGSSVLCQRCEGRATCRELSTLGQPIFCHGTVVGVIGAVAFTPDQRDRLHASSRQLMNFLSRMAGLLESKLLLVEALAEEERRNREVRENHISSSSLSPLSFNDILGQDPAFLATKELAKRVAPSISTVLIRGESGTGKEMFARAIHSAGPRAENPFVAVNCASIPESLLESELFGYEGGAFTGARKGGKVGKFELAHGGTLFLDEIGDLPLHLQPKLLRVLQERQVERVGGTRPIPIDVRIIAATNQNLEQLIAARSFRSDLYYRLNVIPLTIPPLRERSGDILFLTRFFISKYCNFLERPLCDISPETAQILKDYSWPGNVRELENTVEYAVNMAAGTTILPTDLPPPLWAGAGPDIAWDAGKALRAIPEPEPLPDGTLEELVSAYEAEILARYLAEFGTSAVAKTEIATRLGISVATLYRRLSKLRDLIEEKKTIASQE
ncbi:MAG: sigma 54-interacting transcriptional regulator [Firmicutes bacterium]|nr:sigma 54-interacting transcriptional regulator [Bacillota bacterium]